MPTAYTAPLGTPSWLDLGTSDKDESKAFYGAVLGWEFEDGPEELGFYTSCTKGGARVGGMMANDGSMGPDGWSIYFATDDIVKLTEAAAAHDGKVEVPPMAIADLGTMAFVTDRGGAFIGAWQAGTHDGIQARGEHGTPGWFELHTRDWQGSLDFYRDVYGCTIEVVGDTDEFRYAQVMAGGEGVAGIMDAGQWLPEGVPAHWSVYFAVDSTDAAIATAVQHGGAVVQAAEDTPYGRLATCSDSTGAIFKLVQSPE